MQLHNFFNSSTSYRVRIALALKGLEAEHVGVNIRQGEHRSPTYVAELNPSGSVPTVVEGEFRLGQSLAIIDWLDARHPEPRLIPLEPEARARVLELSYAIACDIHPVNNLRVLKYLTLTLGVDEAGKQAWYRHWIDDGMAMVERLLARHGHGPWCFGAAPTLADCCLVPQVANALRMGCDLAPYPRALAAYRHATAHPAFVRAEPRHQPDFVA